MGTKIFKTDLIILGLENVDIIVGTAWITQHQVLLDVVTRALEIHSSTCGELVLYLPRQGDTQSCAFYMIESPLEKRLPWLVSIPTSFSRNCLECHLTET
jgi:hypothetical protein